MRECMCVGGRGGVWVCVFMSVCAYIRMYIMCVCACVCNCSIFEQCRWSIMITVCVCVCVCVWMCVRVWWVCGYGKCVGMNE